MLNACAHVLDGDKYIEMVLMIGLANNQMLLHLSI